MPAVAEGKNECTQTTGCVAPSFSGICSTNSEIIGVWKTQQFSLHV